MSQLDITEILARPSLETDCKDINLMWIGMIKPNDVDEDLIRDSKDRNEFIRLLNKYINAVITFKEARKELYMNQDKNSGKSNFMKATKEYEYYVTQIQDKIFELIEKKDFNYALFEVLLSNEYEKISKENPEEFRGKSDKKILPKLEAFFVRINKGIGYAGTKYDEQKGKYVIREIILKKSLKCMKYNKNNEDRLNDYIKIMYGKEDLTEEEIENAKNKIFRYICANDLDKLYSKDEYTANVYVLFASNLFLAHGYTRDEVEIARKNIDNLHDLWDKVDISTEKHCECMKESVMETINYADIDRLMLLYMYYTLRGYDNLQRNDNNPEVESKREEEEKQNGQYRLKFESENDIFVEMEENESFMKNLLNSNVIPSNTYTTDVRNRRVAIDTIKKSLTNYCDGCYMSDSIVQLLTEDSSEDLNDFSDELLKRIVEKKEDSIIYLSLFNTDSIKRLNKLDLITKESLKKLLEIRKNPELLNELHDEFLNRKISNNYLENISSDELFNGIFEKNLFDADDYRELFTERLISVDDIDKIEKQYTEDPSQNYIETIKNAFNEDFLLSKYNELSKKIIEYKSQINSKHPNDDEIIKTKEELDEAIAQKEEVLSLYKKFYDINELQGDELLLKYLETTPNNAENFSKILETLRLLYEDRLITFEDILSFTGENNYIMEMLSELTFDDINKIRQNRSLEQIKNLLDKIFLNDMISDDEKFVILMNLLADDPGKDAETIREEYRSKLYSSNIEKRNITGNKRNKLPPDPNKKQYEIKLYRDTTKWMFFKLFDEDASVKRYANGYVVFTSKKYNSKIIERYYKDNDLAYGVATYIMTENDWRKNQSVLETVLISDKKNLEEIEVRNIVENEDRIKHRTKGDTNTWMDQIVKYFDIDLSKNPKLRDFIEKEKHNYLILEK